MDERLQDSSPGARRPLKTRNTRWAAAVAARLAARGARPNTISLLSILFAAGAGAAVFFSANAGWVTIPLLVLGAVCIQCRLLCNLLDGMIAVEGGAQSNSGEVYNDFPDRISDVIILVCTGYALVPFPFAAALGWLAAFAALLSAYVRVLAGATGAPQRFLGPMAKQHRMALMTGSFLVAAALYPAGWHHHVLYAALVVLFLGTLATVGRRVVVLVRDLEGT